MAKAKSKKITIEDALVPVEEQPYQIPDNWCWTTLDVVADYKKGPFGSAITKAMFVPKGPDTYKVYEQGNAIRKTIDYGEYYISAEKYEELKGFEVHSGDLIVSCAGTIGETFQLPENIERGVINQALMRVKVSEKVELRYYLYYFDEMLRQDITGNSKGSAMKNIPPFAVLKKFPFPLPPLSEQKRIVEQIENLFAKLDEAREKVQSAIEGYEHRRLMILYKAFSGELTEKWRSENSVEITSWKRKSLKDCSTALGDGLHGTPLYDEDGDYYFVNGNNFDYDHIEIRSDTKRVNESEYKKHFIELTDKTVFVSINGTLGKTAFYDGEPVILGKSACYVNTSDELYKFYLRYFFNTKKFIDYANEMATGSTIKNLGLKAMRSLEINLPSIEEQKEIVRILDVILEKEENSKELAEQVIDSIDMLKKSVLAKAFRGELGTNISEEESSIELLKKMIEEGY